MLSGSNNRVDKNSTDGLNAGANTQNQNFRAESKQASHVKIKLLNNNKAKDNSYSGKEIDLKKNDASQPQDESNESDSQPVQLPMKQCDRLLPLLLGHDGSTNRSVLRVNLIKKSGKKFSQPPHFGLKRLQAPVLQETETSTIFKSTSPSVKDINKVVDEKSNHQVENNGREYDSLRHSNDYEEAKKSQRLVISLIRNLGKNVKKEDLDEMFKEISLTIDEVQREQPEEQPNARVNKDTRSSASQDKNERKEASTNKIAQPICMKNSRNRGFTSSNISEQRHVNQMADESPIRVKSKSNNDIRKEKEKINESSMTEVKKLGADNDISNEDDSVIVCKQLKENVNFVDLSSDDDAIKGSERKITNARLPDRYLRLTSTHAKYISPHRKRSLEERLSRAQEAREKFLEYRANKFKDILKKVQEMRAWKVEDTLNLKALVQTKLQKATAKRKEQLDKIIRKAHDEDSKVSEIQFINSLEAQNRRHEMNSRKKEFEARLQDLQEERLRKFEEKQAKEAAAEERRKTIEAERKAKLMELQQRRKMKAQKVEQQQQVKEKTRIEKNRNREEKITAIKEAFNEGVLTLKKRISKKQELSERRHEVNLRLIRQKAFELSIKRYNSFINESNSRSDPVQQDSTSVATTNKQKDVNMADGKQRLQLKPFNTKKFCNLCKETISSESALFSHLRSDAHYSSVNEHYGDTMLTTNEAVEIHNLRHIVDTDEPLDCDKGSSSQQSSRSSSLVNYYHGSHLNHTYGDICMTEDDRDSLIAIEKKCRKLRHKLIISGKPFNRDWFIGGIRLHLAQLLVRQRSARNQSTNTEAVSLANTIDLSANNPICQQNKPFYLKMNRIGRELISLTTDQRISGGGLMPAGIIHSVDRLLADLNKQLTLRKTPQLSSQLFSLAKHNEKMSHEDNLDADQLAIATKMIEYYAIDTLFLYDIILCLVSILRRIVPDVSLISKLPSTVASQYSTLIDPVSLNSYYCHRSPILPARIYIKMISLIQSLCQGHSDLCYIIFQSNNMIFLSDILSYRLGFIIGNESPASSISGSSSAATLSAQTIDTQKTKQQRKVHGSSNLHSVSSTSSAQESISGSYKVKRQSVSSKMGHNNGAGRRRRQRSNLHKGPLVGNDQESNLASGDQKMSGSNREAGDERDRSEQKQEIGLRNDQEEDDLWDRAETYKRTEEVVDDMTTGLCKLLATVTETILSRPLVLLNQIDKSAFDHRSDDFISYMVSVGIVDTESVIMSHIHQSQRQQQQQPNQKQANQHHSASGEAAQSVAAERCNPDIWVVCDGFAPDMSHESYSLAGGSADAVCQCSSNMSNKITNFTTACIQFVTSLVELVIAKLPGDSPDQPPAKQREQRERQARAEEEEEMVERQQDGRQQLLNSLKVSQLSGALTLLCDWLTCACQLAAQPVQSGHSSLSGQPAAPKCNQPSHCEQLAQLAMASLRLVNHVAYIDLPLFQHILAEDPALGLQVRQVCATLLALWAPLNTARQLLDEAILLLGFFARLNQNNQALLAAGQRPTLVERLSSQLPLEYFVGAQARQVLMPTLVTCAFQNDQICALLSRELSLGLLAAFIEEELDEAQQRVARRQPSQLEVGGHNSALVCAHLLARPQLERSRWHLERRLPKSKWLAAKSYFQARQRKARGLGPNSEQVKGEQNSSK